MSNTYIQGVDDVIKGLEKKLGTEQIKKNMGKACALVENAAKKKAPKTAKSSGDLRKSISSKIEEDGENIVGKVFSPLEYAPYVEYGTGLFAEEGGRKDVPWAYEDEETGELIFTSGQKPQPYLRPALYENRLRIIEILQEGLLDNG